jgi:glycosyltransferase involved in cell wall biosynthesis
VAEADQAICISRAVADELIEEFGKRGRSSERPLEITWFHLGADIGDELVEQDADREAELVPASDKPTFLIVGTIEPRKGHRGVLDAFEALWRIGVDCRLVIVGNPGWKMDDFILHLQTHPELGKRLFWLEQISDTALKQMYALSDCLIAASHGEGFGLPIVEATLHGKPVIARDIPVFREVAPAGTCFFGGSSRTTLAKAIKKWLGNSDRHHLIEDATVLDWRQSAADFLEAVRSNRPYRSIAEDRRQTVVDHASSLLQTSLTR